MAKPSKTENTEVADNATPVADAPAATEGGAPAAKKAGGAAIMITTPDGAQMRRIDYIRQEFAKGRKRGEIAKELGVAYQIVFAATKPEKAAAETAAPAAAEGDTATAEQAAA